MIDIQDTQSDKLPVVLTDDYISFFEGEEIGYLASAQRYTSTAPATEILHTTQVHSANTATKRDAPWQPHSAESGPTSIGAE